MAVPSAPEARLFYRSANQRILDGQFLLAGGRTTAAMYLSGYGVECMLKALILATTSKGERTAVVASYRGAKSHDFVWLKGQYLKNGAPPFPPLIARNFALVNTWTTELRYNPGTAKRHQAQAFLKAAEMILEWADGRL